MTLVVGEAPSRAMRPGDPPLLLARHELAQMAGLGLAQFLERFELCNLLPSWPGRAESGKGDQFPLLEARLEAMRIWIERKPQRMILLGRRVERAFSLREQPWFAWVRNAGGCEVATVPHPSHVSMFWNDVGNRVRAREFWRSASEVINASPR